MLNAYVRGMSSSTQLEAVMVNSVEIAMPLEGEMDTLPDDGGVLTVTSTSAAPVPRPSLASSRKR